MNSSFVIRHSSLLCGASRRKAGFTLVEVVTVVMIIAILMAATTTAISGARKTAMRTHSRDTVRQLANAWSAYLTDQGKFPDQSKFKNNIGNNVFAASPANIGGLLNTQYQRKKGVPDYAKPRSDSITYFATTREECEPKDNARKLDSWPEMSNKTGALGIRDKWKNVVYFTLDFDLDGKIANPVVPSKPPKDWLRTVTSSALAFSTAEFAKKNTNQNPSGLMGNYGRKFLIAY